MSISDVIGIINSIVGICGVVLGGIGIKCIMVANSNKIQQVKDSNIQQAQIIHNGLDSYAIIKLTKGTTQEELRELVKRISETEKAIESQPQIHIISKNDKNTEHIKPGDLIFEVRDK